MRSRIPRPNGSGERRSCWETAAESCHGSGYGLDVGSGTSSSHFRMTWIFTLTPGGQVRRSCVIWPLKLPHLLRWLAVGMPTSTFTRWSPSLRAVCRRVWAATVQCLPVWWKVPSISITSLATSRDQQMKGRPVLAGQAGVPSRPSNSGGSAWTPPRCTWRRVLASGGFHGGAGSRISPGRTQPQERFSWSRLSSWPHLPVTASGRTLLPAACLASFALRLR